MKEVCIYMDNRRKKLELDGKCEMWYNIVGGVNSLALPFLPGSCRVLERHSPSDPIRIGTSSSEDSRVLAPFLFGVDER